MSQALSGRVAKRVTAMVSAHARWRKALEMACVDRHECEKLRSDVLQQVMRLEMICGEMISEDEARNAIHAHIQQALPRHLVASRPSGQALVCKWLAHHLLKVEPLAILPAAAVPAHCVKDYTKLSWLYWLCTLCALKQGLTSCAQTTWSVDAILSQRWSVDDVLSTQLTKMIRSMFDARCLVPLAISHLAAAIRTDTERRCTFSTALHGKSTVPSLLVLVSSYLARLPDHEVDIVEVTASLPQEVAAIVHFIRLKQLCW